MTEKKVYNQDDLKKLKCMKINESLWANGQDIFIKIGMNSYIPTENDLIGNKYYNNKSLENLSSN